MLTTGYTDIVSGAFPARRRYYLGQVGQTYSSTYTGLANFGEGQDLLNDTWTVDGTALSKQEVIDITKDLLPGGSGSGPLNDVTPIASTGLTDATTLGMYAILLSHFPLSS